MGRHRPVLCADKTTLLPSTGLGIDFLPSRKTLEVVKFADLNLFLLTKTGIRNGLVAEFTGSRQGILTLLGSTLHGPLVKEVVACHVVLKGTQPRWNA